MKKILLSVLLAFVLAGGLFAIDLGNFPSGSWVDENYDAVWTFSVDNIELFLGDGTKVFDFKDKMDKFLVAPGANGVELSFTCEEAGRSYKFVKELDITSKSIKMFIKRTDGVQYQVVMPMK